MSEAFDPLSVAQDLSEIDVSDPMIFKNDAFRPIFARLRQEAPVHYCKESPFGPYWSITRFHDIMAVDKNHHDFSSQGGVSIGNRSADFEAPNFISMDPPKHDLQRKAVTGVVAPMNLAKLEPVIRERAGWILDDLPTGESFNWVDQVSIELTTQMLATIFDFPFEERHKLTAWSDLATSSVATGGTLPDEDRREGLMQCLSEFTDLWNERVHWDPSEHNDLITLMANDPATCGDGSDGIFGELNFVDCWGERHNAKFDFWWRAGVESVSSRVSKAQCQSGLDCLDDSRNYSLANAADPYASHRKARCVVSGSKN